MKLGGRRQLPSAENDPIAVWPDMADGWALFLSMGTQWRWASAGMGGTFQTGLDYGPIEAVARSAGIKLDDSGRIPPRVFLDLRTLESETLRYWSSKRN